MRKNFLLVMLGFSLIGLGGCQSSNTTQPQSQQPATSSNSAAPSNSSQPSRRESSSSSSRTRTAAAAPAPAPPPKPVYVTVPVGTVVAVQLSKEISTGIARSGSTFSGTLAAPIKAQGYEIAPSGSTVQGQATNVVSAGRLNRPAELTLVLTSITRPDGSVLNIATTPWSEKGKSHTKRNAVAIGGGAGVGALIGALAGHGKGALIGGAIGAGAGTAGAALTGKKEIVLPAETALQFHLSKSLHLQETP